jgi:hypothetical protein
MSSIPNALPLAVPPELVLLMEGLELVNIVLCEDGRGPNTAWVICLGSTSPCKGDIHILLLKVSDPWCWIMTIPGMW